MSPGSSRVYILKHVPNEDAGTLLDFLKKEKIPHTGVDLYDGVPLPALNGARALVIMGGPMNVDEEGKYPFLKAEIAFLKEAIQKKAPCLGICLGSQLLAKALGARVYKAAAPEIGWDEMTLTDEASRDAVFSVVPSGKFKVLQWHEDTFDLPKGAVRLASSPVAPNQAFRYEKHVYGLQFHVEVNKAMLADWFKKSPEVPKILKEYEEYRDKLSEITDGLYRKFFEIQRRG